MNAKKLRRWALIGILVIEVCSSRAEAISVEANSISLSTISALANTNGLNITAPVYIVAGSSLSLQASTGFILGQSSITSSAFFGDGFLLSNVATLRENLTWGGPPTFLSSFTIQSAGRQISLSTGTATNNLVISTSGVTFYPELHNSTSTIIPNSQTTATACNVCVAGSTLTIVTSGGSVEVVFTGALENTSPGEVRMKILQDGAPLMGTDYMRRANPQNMHSAAISTRYLIKAPSAGSHSYCISICDTSSAAGTLLNDATDANIFFVKELK